MNKYSLSLLVDSTTNLEAQLKKTNAELAEIFDMDSDRRKVQSLIRVIAELQIELNFTQETMRVLIDRQTQKKFWQFWK